MPNSEVPLDRESKVQTVKRLLTHAESTLLPEEAQSYRDKAMSLIAKWSVEEAELSEGGVEFYSTELFFEKGFEFEWANLVSAIANGLQSTRCYYAEGPKRSCALIVGRQQDVERVEMLFGSLSTQARTESLSLLSQPDSVKHFINGFAVSVGDKLAALTRYESKQRSKDLVLKHNLSDIDRHIETAFGTVGSVAVPNRVSTAYLDGMFAGVRADIGNSLKEGDR